MGVGEGVGTGVPVGGQLGPTQVKFLTLVPSQGKQLGFGGSPQTRTFMATDSGGGSGITNVSVSLPSKFPLRGLLHRNLVGVVGQSPFLGATVKTISSPAYE